MKEMSTFVKVCIVAVSSIMGLILMAGGYIAVANIFSGNDGTSMTKSYAAADVKSLMLDIGACEVQFKVSADADFHLDVKNVRNVKADVDKNVLKITEKTSFSLFNRPRDRYIALYIPEGFEFEKVNLEMGAGSFNCEYMSSDELCVKASAAEMNIAGANIGKLNAAVSAGKLDLAGDISEKADIECATGEVNINLAGSEKDYNYKVASSLGSIKLGSNSLSGTSNSQIINNGAEKDFTIDNSLGDVKVAFAE